MVGFGHLLVTMPLEARSQQQRILPRKQSFLKAETKFELNEVAIAFVFVKEGKNLTGDPADGSRMSTMLETHF